MHIRSREFYIAKCRRLEGADILRLDSDQKPAQVRELRIVSEEGDVKRILLALNEKFFRSLGQRFEAQVFCAYAGVVELVVRKGRRRGGMQMAIDTLRFSLEQFPTLLLKI